MELFKVDSLKKVFVHLGIIFLIFLGLLIFFFYVYLPKATHHDQTITVPKLVGMNEAELESFLNSKNLRYQINDSSYTPGTKAHTVLTQHPLPDAKVKENRMIYITIASLNPPEVEMPNLKDQSLKGAQIMLNQYGLVSGEIISVPGKQDLVYEQLVNGASVAPGTKVPKGTKVSLKVGNASNTEVPLPDFVDMDINSAKEMAAQNGLILEIRPDPNAVDGTIIRQKPSTDEVSTIKSGEIIDVWTQ